MKNANIKNIVSILILILFTAQVIFSSKYYVTNQKLFDFQIYLRASKLWNSYYNPYQQPFGVGKIEEVPFNYPPASLYFFSLFSFFPDIIAQIIFTILSFMAFVISFIFIDKIVDSKFIHKNLGLIIAFSILSFPFKLTLILGQINSIILLLVVLSYFTYTKKYLFLSSIFLAIAACFKIYPIFLLLLFLTKKEFKYTAITFGIFILLNLSVHGLFTSYFTGVFPSLFNSVPDIRPYNQSIYSFFIRLGIGYTDAKLASNLVFVSLLLNVIYVNIKKSLTRSYFMFFALLSITGQFSWQHHLMYTYPFALIYFRKIHYLLAIFLLFALHFLDTNSFLAKNAYLVSYQTLGIIIMILFSIYLELRVDLDHTKI